MALLSQAYNNIMNNNKTNFNSLASFQTGGCLVIFRDVPNLGSEPFTLENGNSSKMDIFFLLRLGFH